MKDTFDYHRANPDMTLEAHVKNRIVELGMSLDGRVPVYLDTNFWVNLQKAASSDKAPEDHRELLRLLRYAVGNGRLFCPVSESIFLELLKQSDRKSRLETAALIDELSLGVAMLEPQTRAATELAHLAHSFTGDKDGLHPLHHLVWHKVPYVLGLIHPHPTAFDEATQLLIQKAFFDEMWDIPLAKMIGMLTELPDKLELNLDDSATILNAGIAENADSIRSFQQVFEAELQGVADVYADTLVDIINQMNPDQSARTAPKNETEKAEVRRMAYNLLFHALKSNKEARRSLPSLYVHACLHAAIRWDKLRRLKGNDLYDFNHASAALANCRLFFTERPLHALVAGKNIGLDKLFDCQIVSSVPDAIACLENLLKASEAIDAASAQL